MDQGPATQTAGLWLHKQLNFTILHVVTVEGSCMQEVGPCMQGCGDVRTMRSEGVAGRSPQNTHEEVTSEHTRGGHLRIHTRRSPQDTHPRPQGRCQILHEAVYIPGGQCDNAEDAGTWRACCMAWVPAWLSYFRRAAGQALGRGCSTGQGCKPYPGTTPQRAAWRPAALLYPGTGQGGPSNASWHGQGRHRADP